MPFMTIPFVFNLLTGIMIWYSNLSTTFKIILTVLVVVKYLLFFYIALITDSDLTKKIGVIIGNTLNATVICIALANGVTTVVISNGVTFCLLFLWYIVTSFSISKREENKR